MKEIHIKIHKKGYARLKNLQAEYNKLSYKIDELLDDKIISTTNHILLFEKTGEIIRLLDKIMEETL